MIMIAKNMQIRRYNHTRISKKKMLFIVTSPTPLFIADIASLQAMHHTLLYRPPKASQFKLIS